MEAASLIRLITSEAQQQLDQLYRQGEPVIGSSLDQAGLRDGQQVVEDYLSNNEAGPAFEHLLYMLTEPPLTLSASRRSDLCRTAELLGMAHLLHVSADPTASATPERDTVVIAGISEDS